MRGGVRGAVKGGVRGVVRGVVRGAVRRGVREGVRGGVRGAVEHMTLILVTEWSAIVTDVFVMIIVKHTDLVYMDGTIAITSSCSVQPY